MQIENNETVEIFHNIGPTLKTTPGNLKYHNSERISDEENVRMLP